jgi:hypothetical protein
MIDEKKNVFIFKNMTSLIGRCTVGVTVVFWQLVSLGVFAYAMAFLFWPTEVNTLFVTEHPVNTIRFMGVLFLLADAGLNQMVETSSGTTSPLIKRTAFTSTILFYILAGSAGIVVTSLDDKIFSDEQTLAFQILFSLFVGALSLGLLGVCGGFCSIRSSMSTNQLETIVEVGTRPSTKSGVSRDDIRKGRT